jgi:hypothetical protein
MERLLMLWDDIDDLVGLVLASLWPRRLRRAV